MKIPIHLNALLKNIKPWTCWPYNVPKTVSDSVFPNLKMYKVRFWQKINTNPLRLHKALWNRCKSLELENITWSRAHRYQPSPLQLATTLQRNFESATKISFHEGLKKITKILPPNTQRHKTTTVNSHLFLRRRALRAGTGLGSFYRRLGHRGQLLVTFGGNKRGWRGCACGAYKGRKGVWSRRDTGRHWRFFPARSPPPSLWRHCVYINFLVLVFVIYIIARVTLGFNVFYSLFLLLFWPYRVHFVYKRWLLRDIRSWLYLWLEVCGNHFL